jgi:hypothetical protein
MNLPEANGATSNRNEHSGESIPFDPSSPTSKTPSACIESGFNNTASFVPATNFPDLPLDHPYDIEDHFPGEYYAGPGPKTIRGFDMAVPISMPPQGLKRKRESEDTSHVDATRPACTHNFPPPVTAQLQPYPAEYSGESYDFLQQGFLTPGLSATEALAQPKEGHNISYHFGY